MTDDRELEQYLKGGSALSRKYRHASREPAPPELDEVVLALASAEAKRKPRPKPWLTGLALAASVVLAVNLAWHLREQSVPAASQELDQLGEESAGAAVAQEPLAAAKPEAQPEASADAPPQALAKRRAESAIEKAPPAGTGASAGAAVLAAEYDREEEMVARATAESQRNVFARVTEGGNRSPTRVTSDSTAPAAKSDPAEAKKSTGAALNSERKAAASDESMGSDLAKVPHGWIVTGAGQEYRVALSYEERFSGRASAVIENRYSNPQDFAGLGQWIPADAYRGKRVVFEAYVKADEVEGWAGLCLRIDGPTFPRDAPLAFDNMHDRPIKGTSQWTRYSVMLDVPQGARGIFYGPLLAGRGRIHVDSARLVPLDEIDGTVASPTPQLAKNLDFEY